MLTTSMTLTKQSVNDLACLKAFFKTIGAREDMSTSETIRWAILIAAGCVKRGEVNLSIPGVSVP